MGTDPPLEHKMDRGLVLVLAAASGLVVANSYYAQPLLAPPSPTPSTLPRPASA